MPATRSVDQAITFFDHWFRTNISGTRNDRYRIVVRSPNLASPSSIALSDTEWIERFNMSSEGGLTDLLAAMGGHASMYPWYVRVGNGQRVGLFDVQNEQEKVKACPGVWVDLRGSFHTTRLHEFIEWLVWHDVPAPTVATGRDMDGTLDYFDSGRLWWRTEWDLPTKLSRDLQASHAAWGIHIQEHAQRFGLCHGLPVNGFPTMSEALYPLPGSDGISVLYTNNEPVPWRSIDIATDRRLDDLKTQREQFVTLNAVSPNVLWDQVLVPQGWRSRGMGAGMHEQWWSAPGSMGLMTAMTDGVTLRLYLPDWLSGLKEASDAGVVLNKWTVACILGWDGDVTAFVEHWDATGELY